MSEETSYSLINLGELTKPATILIEKISNAAGVLYEPRRIRNIEKVKADAKADAALIEAKSEIEITDLHQRAKQRRIEEDAQHQKRMEDITAQALPQLNENAKPNSIENDWLINFFDKCRLVADNEMQELWSRVLAGEANAPGTYSKRTVNFLSDLDKGEAELFTKLCGFSWMTKGDVVPLVFDTQAEIYNKDGINFNALSHLDSIGFIQFGNLSGFAIEKLSKRFAISYGRRTLILEMPSDADNEIGVGKVLLTRVGQELAPICGSKPVEGFWEYVKDQWKQYLPKSKTE